MSILWASRDRVELEQALWRHLTEAPSSRRPRPRVAYAFELWITHLVLLEQMLALVSIPWKELRSEELDGLVLLRQARERFRREYRACADCGAPVKGTICPRCGAVG